MMKLVKEFRFLVLLLMVVMLTQNVGAVPVEWGTSLENRTVDFYGVAAPVVKVAEVACNVYRHWPVGPHADQFVYTYRITNTSDAELSFFSVTILGGSYMESPEYGNDGVQPAKWDIVTSYGRVEALFTTSIGSGYSSALLWFFSDHEYADCGRGALSGMSSDGYVFAVGDNLLTPVPEPAAITLLAMGGLALLGKRRSD